MATNRKVGTSGLLSHSRTLFLTSHGEPLRFYIRPGPTKSSLLPLIIHGGGVMCRVQEPGAILLADSAERDGMPSGYTRTQYVLDCVQQNQQLSLEDYTAVRSPPQRQARSSAAGRVAYTKLEDVAILMYVRDHGGAGSVRGNALWREMERVQLTRHSWQSMRTRYLQHLRGREHLYQIDSRSVIPTAVFSQVLDRQPPKPEAENYRVKQIHNGIEDMRLQMLESGATNNLLEELSRLNFLPQILLDLPSSSSRLFAASMTLQFHPGEKNNGSLKHAERESNEDASFPDEQESDGVNSEEEFFNIFPVAIREFEIDETPEQLKETGDVTEAENILQEQQMQTDKQPEVGLSERCPKRKGTMAELIPGSDQMETDKPQEVSLGEPCAKRKGTTAKIIVDNKQMEAANLPEVSIGDQQTKKRALSEFIVNNKQSESDSRALVDELSLPTASQDEVECATMAISTLMQTHDLDLCTATQLLLKNNGELAAVLHFMETGHRPDGYPIWTHQDDLDLESVDRKVRGRLIQKFGSENLAKRIAFRKS